MLMTAYRLVRRARSTNAFSGEGKWLAGCLLLGTSVAVCAGVAQNQIIR
jgi:hypothetical protein